MLDAYIPYTKAAILDYLSKLLPNDGIILETWIDDKFKTYEYYHRKLPLTISLRTLRFQWVKKYKLRGHFRKARSGYPV